MRIFRFLLPLLIALVAIAAFADFLGKSFARYLNFGWFC